MRITLGTASLAQIEEGGRNYEANLLNRYLSEEGEDAGYCSGCYDGCEDCDIAEPEDERITERDIDIAAEEMLRHEEEMFIVEMTFNGEKD